MRAHMVRRTASALLGVAPLGVLAVCADMTSGQPIPEQQTRRVPRTAAGSADYSLARLCELLSDDEAQQFGAAGAGEKKNSVSDGHEICTWTDATHLALGFQDGMATANVRTGEGITNTPTTINCPMWSYLG